jgi:hypothetical protein
MLKKVKPDSTPATLPINNSSGWWFGTFFIFPFHIWDANLPIDKLHYFSRWLLHHQPVMIY